jgi:hypothetical protein
MLIMPLKIMLAYQLQTKQGVIVMIEKIRGLNITSSMAYGASLLSILLSIAIWSLRRDEDPDHAERFGIFVGLWAPTLAIFAHALEQHEHRVS